MNEVELQLPVEAVVRGTLYAKYDISDLDQDILEVDLPNGLILDVGWYPEYDRQGQFRIPVYEGTWENQRREPVYCSLPQEVARIIEEISRGYADDAATDTKLHTESTSGTRARS